MNWMPTEADRDRCREIAAERVRRAGGRERFAWPDPEGRELAGVYGERAAALAMGYTEHWPSVDSFGEGSDLPGGEEVRAGRFPNAGLIIAEKDTAKAGRPYILAVPKGEGWRAAWWIMGRDAMVRRFWRGDLPYPAWLVPQQFLRPLDELIQPDLFREA